MRRATPHDPQRAASATGRRACARWGAAAWGALCGAGLLAAALAGCSIEKNYKVLSFFFDGVPDPEAMKNATAAERAAAMRLSPTYVVHAPYAQEKCAECHVGMQFGELSSSVCLKCHAGKPTEHEVMHGPVAAGACLWCHSPHESAYASLLKHEPRETCVQCHAPGMLRTDRVAAHGDPARDCLDCHGAHGGTARYFLRGEAAGPPG
jgi:predicted CXXCH cytochrome family protein